jgi:hypothetical protein
MDISFLKEFKLDWRLGGKGGGRKQTTDQNTGK